jgi:hypothetical protein
MALIDGYYSFSVRWDDEATLPCLFIKEAKPTDCLLHDFFNNIYILAYNIIPYCCLEGNDDYSFEYHTIDKKLAILRLFVSWPTDENYGFVESSVDSNDCILGYTDHAGNFEFFVFKNMKHKEDELLDMLKSGKLKDEIHRFKSQNS